MTIHFRPARPDDAAAAIPLIYSSGPGTFNYVFTDRTRGTPQEFLRAAFADEAGEFGFGTHTVAVVEGAVVGIGTGFSGDTALAFMLAAARQIMSFYRFHAGSIIRRGLQVEQLMPLPSRAMQYIGHMGVAPEWRGHGIGQQLIEYLIAQGQAAGRSVAALDVSVANPRAQALYERLGFVVTRERQSKLRNEFATVADHRRMERQIAVKS